MKKCLFLILVLVFATMAYAKPIKEDVDRIDIVHKDKGFGAKPLDSPGKPVKSALCYSAKYWGQTGRSILLNPNNGDMSSADVIGAFAASVTEWQSHTSSVLYSTIAEDVTESYGDYDGRNVVDFGPLDNANYIAVTSMWISKRTKEIVEWDMRFNTASSWTWGDSTHTDGVMDFQNIATHELGHTLGLLDLYTDSCNQVTMYGYSGIGETSKRSLEQPDIAGLQTIYG